MGKIVAVLAAAVLVLAAAPAVADRGPESTPSIALELKRRGCVTVREFNLPPIDGVDIWGKRKIEREWGIRGIYRPELSGPGTLVFTYRKCGRRAFDVRVDYLDEPGRPWTTKSMPCACARTS